MNDDEKLVLSFRARAAEAKPGDRWPEQGAALEAAEALANEFHKLAESGDAGFWKADDIEEYTRLRAALKKVGE